MTYKEALIAKGYSLTDTCGCNGTPKETYALNQNKFIVKPKKNMALHYFANKQVKAMMSPELVQYLDTI